MKRLMLVLVAVMGLMLLTISTATACECYPIGTGTPGYWMNHPEAWPLDMDTIDVGGQIFTKEEAIALIKSPVKGDKTLTMFASFVAAKLNVVIGNCPPACYSLAEVNTWLTNFPVNSGVKANSEAWQYSHGEALYWCLDGYNNGLQNGSPSRDTSD